jgi:hypothetical protein
MLSWVSKILVLGFCLVFLCNIWLGINLRLQTKQLQQQQRSLVGKSHEPSRSAQIRLSPDHGRASSSLDPSSQKSLLESLVSVEDQYNRDLQGFVRSPMLAQPPIPLETLQPNDLRSKCVSKLSQALNQAKIPTIPLDQLITTVMEVHICVAK